MGRIDKELLEHGAEFRRALAKHQYEITDDGRLLFREQRVFVAGVYEHSVNGGDVRRDTNIVVTEGLNHILSSALDAGTQIASWYMALFGGNVTPANTWTAANFAGNSTEITSTTEGYTESTRPAVNFAAPAGGAINNTANKAAFTIATASALAVYGAGILSVATRGGTTGTLLSSVRFAAVRSLQDADAFSVGYTLTLTSS